MITNVPPATPDDEARWLGPRGRARLAWTARVSRTRKETLAVGRRRFAATFRGCQGGGVVVTFPALPHLATHGGTLTTARRAAVQTLRDYLNDLDLPGERLAA